MEYYLEYVFKIRNRFCDFNGIKEREGHPMFLIRVDDFPHWERTLDDFKRFHSIMEKFNAPYLLGVIPCMSIDIYNPFNNYFNRLDREQAQLIKHPLIEVAMHGFSHQTNSPGEKREFAGIKKEEVIEKIEKGLGIFNEYGIRPAAFIPPFDRIDMTFYEVIAGYFKIITGGRASVKNMGYKLSPVLLKDALYVPSYRPLYSTCYRIVNFLKQKNINREILLPIVIHWADEPDYTSLTELLNMVKGYVLNWKILLKSAYE